ncbi:helix-turn-helix domain-containing protein [Pseudomonas rubra]|uniref:Helix-turn-helix domain-containing protein n=1 Tax=Pseudomonas rubra TaxID=2942627 RepID=A0ABT5PAP1_9PSED|nr:helix-turn-helix domain-containing protein [Pseudomonas rubra]MDD1015369.1 helix-turn-helix domain-containing protein [Pseudomonas rubra]MDD1039591.1 helix-turn-helix domain-containing protein [Pseudomonas rubra]MDD1153983.1 helix-turn-helix domain-containing protein [Pseudomonas rubra]
MSKASIPVFKLYGEQLQWPTPDLLHCESIPVRSRVHDWEIEPHRHADLCQLLFLYTGQAEIEVEGRVQRLDQAAIQVVPALCVHGFRFSSDVDGYVVTLAAPLVNVLHTQLAGAPAALAQAGTYLAGADRTHLYSLFSALQQEYQQEQPGRDLQLRSLINLLVVWISRQCLQRHGQGLAVARGREYLERFNSQVEQQFRQQPSVEALAHQVGISVAHLNSICRELAGQSALQIIHQRLLLEAKRELIYTSLSIKQLAESLGFTDPAYFSRFFRRLTGKAPSDFRQQAARHAT